jgi:cytochrome c oxidase subunit 4
MSSHDHHNDEHGAHHITPLWLYHGIFGALLCLTVITVWVSPSAGVFDFGSATTLIAMLVATIKATLVALFFMHLLHDERLNMLTFGFGLLFVCLFFLFPLVDIGTRTFVDPIKDNSSVVKLKEVTDAQTEHADKYKNVDLSRVHPTGFIETPQDEK